MNAWEPSEADVQWLVNVLDKLKVGGIWVAPSYGVIFRKTDENTLALQPPLIRTPKATQMIERTKTVAEKAGIYIEKPMIKYWRAELGDLVVDADTEKEAELKLRNKLQDWQNIEVIEFYHDEDLNELLNGEEKTPTPSDEVENSYECEVCGKAIPQGKERRMKDGETMLCSECAREQPDDHFL